MDPFFPNGVLPYVEGGLLIGLGIGVIYLLAGRIAGLSSYLTAVHSWWSRHPFFDRGSLRAEGRWKSVLVIGLVIGAAGWTFTQGGAYQTEVQWWRLLIGGFLVGIGTRHARGCTSGHGICGMSALAPPSIVATLVFMGTAIVVAHLVSAMGVTP